MIDGFSTRSIQSTLMLFLLVTLILSLQFTAIKAFSRPKTHCPEECYQNLSIDTNQRTQSSNVQNQCPCVKAPGSNECVSYDNRLQATTIEEALFEFPDFVNFMNGNKPLVDKNAQPTLLRGGINPYLKSKVATASAPVKSTEGYDCYSLECQSCKALIINGFVENAGINISNTTVPPLADQTYCEQKRAKELDVKSKTKNETSDETSAPVVSQIVQLLRSSRRKKRESNSSGDVNLLGIATKIGCDYRRGEEISSGWSGLCNLCWQWRKLPEDYFPTYLNEVACDDSDKACLAGFGNCRPILRSVNVLRNLGTSEEPKWEQQSINTIAACECQVELGTPLHSLVLR